MVKCWKWTVKLKSEAGRYSYRLPTQRLTVVFEDGFFYVAGVKVLGHCNPSKDNIPEIIRSYLLEHYKVPKKYVVVKRGSTKITSRLPLWQVSYHGRHRTEKEKQLSGHADPQLVRAEDAAAACRIVAHRFGVKPSSFRAVRASR